MDYSQTCNCPRQIFRCANLPKRSLRSEFWKKNDIYAKLQNGARQKEGLASSCMMAPRTPMAISISAPE